MKNLKDFQEAVPQRTTFPDLDRFIDRKLKNKKYKGAAQMYVRMSDEQGISSPGHQYELIKRVAKMTRLDIRNLVKVIHQLTQAGVLPGAYDLPQSFREEKMKYTAKDDIFILDVESETEDEGEVFITRGELGDPDYVKGQTIDQEELDDVFGGLDEKEVSELFEVE